MILVKQILQHQQKCETGKLQHENKAVKAKVRALAVQLQNEKDKERLLNANGKLLTLLSKRLESKSYLKELKGLTCSCNLKNKTKNRRSEVEIDFEEEDDGQRQTCIVTKVIQKYVPYGTYQLATPEQVNKW